MVGKLINRKEALDWVLLLSFFLSGVCALMYQVSWQRSLFGIVGVDIDSITIIVSVFMLGIGFGGMLGGWLADRASKRRIQVYALTEFSIALYGFFSLYLLQVIDSWVLGFDESMVNSVISSMAFLVVPTLLMGITLPLLTLSFNEWKGNIGVSVGQLYFVNTLGAAVGAGLVPFILLPMMPLDYVIKLAALGNIVVMFLALLAHFSWKRLSYQIARERQHS